MVCYARPASLLAAIVAVAWLVFEADAAIPDRSAGTAPRTDEVTGTTQVPMPMPANPSAAASGR